MKSLFIFFLSVCCVGGVSAQSALLLASTSVSEDNQLAWSSTSHDFGNIKHQQPQTVSFTFTNASDKVVVITEAKGSCGCTVASYTQEPITPGEKGTVKATYNAAKLGTFNKTVMVKTTASNEWRHLKITGVVVK